MQGQSAGVGRRWARVRRGAGAERLAVHRRSMRTAAGPAELLAHVRRSTNNLELEEPLARADRRAVQSFATRLPVRLGLGVLALAGAAGMLAATGQAARRAAGVTASTVTTPAAAAPRAHRVRVEPRPPHPTGAAAAAPAPGRKR